MKLLSLLFLSFLTTTLCSSGDKRNDYLECTNTCRNENCKDEQYYYKNLYLPLRIFKWSCQENCNYECMMSIYHETLRKKEKVEQFHGKWPFYRVFGIQELFSCLFSIANGWAHIYNYRKLMKEVGDKSVYSYLYFVYALISINLWIWSTVFHARDNTFTERMDYFSAYLSLVYGLYFAVIRTFKLSFANNKVTITSLTLGGVFMYVYHLAVMINNFDYQYNMIMGVTIGMIHNLIWIAWSCYNSFFTTIIHPYRWQPTKCAILISLAMSLELLDFPPFMGLIDAHSLWHLSTIFIIPVWYKFFIEDAKFLALSKNKDAEKLR